MLKPTAVALTVLALVALGIASVTGKETKDSDEERVKIKVIRVDPVGYEPAAVTKDSKEGEQFFQNLNCMACHSMHNSGGTLGPMLDGIGAHRSKEFIKARLENSAEAQRQFAKLVGRQPSPIFEHVRISADKADKIADYLMTVPEPAGGFIVTPHIMRIPHRGTTQVENYKPQEKNASSQAGEKIYVNAGCMACHQVGNIGGWLAPPLDGVGGKLNRTEIVSQISNPSAHAAGTVDGEKRSVMPAASLPEKDIQKLVDYLMTLPSASK